jgi:hypothetical protein
MEIVKYPRTRHVSGSCLQEGDEDMKIVPFEELKGKYLVIEEKVDGANSGLSFDAISKLYLQSRGHYLAGGWRERHFNLLKQWANIIARQLWNAIGDQYIVYGEWMYAKHTVFYDFLPHYFMEFDVWDISDKVFLSTGQRRLLLSDLPIQPVLVLAEGRFETFESLVEHIGPSRCKSNTWISAMMSVVEHENSDWEKEWQGTDHSDLMEGLYIKWEEDGVVKDRYKFVRQDFTTKVANSEEHWLERTIIPNQLRPGVNIFDIQSKYGV